MFAPVDGQGQGLFTDLNLPMFEPTVSHSKAHSLFLATISNWDFLPFGMVKAETLNDFKLKYCS